MRNRYDRKKAACLFSPFLKIILDMQMSVFNAQSNVDSKFRKKTNGRATTNNVVAEF